jgi:hypothetical protein
MGLIVTDLSLVSDVICCDASNHLECLKGCIGTATSQTMDTGRFL